MAYPTTDPGLFELHANVRNLLKAVTGNVKQCAAGTCDLYGLDRPTRPGDVLYLDDTLRREESHMCGAAPAIGFRAVVLNLLMFLTGDKKSACKGCGAPVWWLMTKRAKRAPYTENALNHFADCPKADTFRKGRA